MGGMCVAAMECTTHSDCTNACYCENSQCISCSAGYICVNNACAEEPEPINIWVIIITIALIPIALVLYIYFKGKHTEEKILKHLGRR